MVEQPWRCPTCGATNTEGNRCRICRLLVPGLPATPQAPPHAPSQAPPPPVPPSPSPPVGPPAGYTPPGGWLPTEPAAPAGPSYPPPPPPPSGYPMPPAGWYPGAPVPPKGQRRTGLIVLAIVVPVLVLAAIGLVFIRGTDPAAARDRDNAEKALITNGDLNGTFTEIAHRSFARSRGGLRVEGSVTECSATDSAAEKDVQAVVDSVLQSQNAITGGQVVAEEIMIVGSPSSATPLVDVLVSTAERCVTATIEGNQSTGGLSVSLDAAPPPDLGDRAAAFRGALGLGGGAAEVDIVVVQQGRAIVLVMTVDATGSMHRLIGDLVNASLVRLAPTFGTGTSTAS